MNLTRVFIAVLALCATMATQAAKIVVSIEPLAMLVEPLLGPQDSLHVLLKPNTSPHHYSLKASDMRALQQADLILWVGPELEQFLQKPLAALPASMQLDKLTSLTWPKNMHDAGSFHEHGHAHGGRDPHLWLNPDNGVAIAKAVAQQLATLPSVDLERLEAQLSTMVGRVEALTIELELTLADLRSITFIAYHEAYGHWNQRFQLSQLAAVSLSPEQKPGARHIYELKSQAKGAQCLVAEAFYNNQSSQQLARQLGLPLVVLDPLGTNITSIERRYETLLRNLAADMQGCLPANG